MGSIQLLLVISGTIIRRLKDMGVVLAHMVEVLEDMDPWHAGENIVKAEAHLTFPIIPNIAS
jgi:hypothetical protein